MDSAHSAKNMQYVQKQKNTPNITTMKTFTIVFYVNFNFPNLFLSATLPRAMSFAVIAIIEESASSR